MRDSRGGANRLPGQQRVISSASRALKILQIVGRAPSPIGVAEIARSLDVVPGTAFRSLNALEALGYVERYRSSARYVLGPAVSQLHHQLLSRYRLRELSIPYLDQLAFATGETVALVVPVGWYSLRLAAAQGTNDVTSHSPIGEIKMLARTAAGRTILAALSERELAGYAAWSAERLPAAAADSGLTDALARIARRGFALEATSYAPGRCSAALPIRRNGHVIAAIAVDGPVLDADADASDEDARLRMWLAALAPLEKAVSDWPPELAGPFGHLPRDQITLEVDPD